MAQATAQEARGLYRQMWSDQLGDPAELPEGYASLNLVIVDGIDGDLSSLPAALAWMRKWPDDMDPVEDWHELWDLWDVRIAQLTGFLERGGFQREFEDIVGGWVQALQDELFTYDKPKPVLGASIPFEERSL